MSKRLNNWIPKTNNNNNYNMKKKPNLISNYLFCKNEIKMYTHKHTKRN